VRVPVRVLFVAAVLVACGPSGAPETAGDTPAVPGAVAPGMPLDTAPDTPVSSEAPADPGPPGAGAGGTGGGAAPSAGAAAQEPAIRGRVVAGGTDHEPVTSLQRPDAPPLIVTGPLASELRRLAGATVEVRGAVSGVARRTIHVESYEIVEIDGARPTVGTVLSGGRLAAGADTLHLLDPPAGLPVGGRVWVTGERRDGRLRVASWGIIAEATPQ
jgi:hypothetical protein